MFNQISKIAGVGFATAMTLALSANNAQAFDFTFSFDNTDLDETPGTVKGTIIGLNEGTGSASSILITDYPAGLGGTFEQGNDVVTWSNQQENSFTVTGGVITAASFGARSLGDDSFFLGDNSFSENTLTLNNYSNRSWNFDGFAGATYAAATPVPFGVSTDLSLLILGGLYGASRLRKKFAASK